eukprot:GSChrysophyteH1.ASY1.ANO1.853.1 assembled CDS
MEIDLGEKRRGEEGEAGEGNQEDKRENMEAAERNISDLISLCYTGALLGSLHIFTPDHLAALSSLSVGGSWKSFTLGVRWSIGHSLGLLFVTFLFLVIPHLDLRSTGSYCDALVGVGMCIIGGAGVRSALRDYSLGQEKKVTPLEGGSPEDGHQQQILSLGIGILHGVAGPGGILGVLPAIEMRNWRSSTIYLGSFIFASTVSMGLFAALYGETTRRLGSTMRAELFLRVFSSGASVLVGLVWLCITGLGGVSVGSFLEGSAAGASMGREP